MTFPADRGGEVAATAAEPVHAARPVRGVLVPLDGSRLAEEALAIGASWARRGGAPLHLVSAIAPVLEAVRREFPDLAERETQDEIATRMATSSRWRRSFARPVRERSPCRS